MTSNACVEEKTTAAASKEAASMADKTTTDLELVEVFKQRAANYGFLSRLYREEIDMALLEELHAMHYRVSSGNEDVDEGYRLIAAYLCGIWENTPIELAADYMRVFFGHGYNGHAAAYPFESVYTSEKRLLMQGARDEVLALYRAAGLEKQESWKEGEDHIALELEYMQILANRSASALDVGDEDEAVALVRSQQNFLDDHLMGWVPMMTVEMKKFARTDFYRGLAYLTDGLLSNDKELLDNMLSE